MNTDNARLCKNRLELLTHMPVNSVAAEIGVDEGNFSQQILDITKPKKLYLIDSWKKATNKYNKVVTKFKDSIKTGQVVILHCDSCAAVQYIKHNLNWIYLDASHQYKPTKRELNSYRLKMAPNGIIAGHDFIMQNWKNNIRYGVIEAVDEFCAQYQYELLWLTLSLPNEMPSFAIAPINGNV
jgi:hypothetical protein